MSWKKYTREGGGEISLKNKEKQSAIGKRRFLLQRKKNEIFADAIFFCFVSVCCWVTCAFQAREEFCFLFLKVSSPPKTSEVAQQCVVLKFFGKSFAIFPICLVYMYL